jgi:hypothetical protein
MADVTVMPRAANVSEVKAELQRLRSLIKQAERAGGDLASGLCPWCRSWVQHSVACPAFTPEGEVR